MKQARETILLVEDDANDVLLFERALRKACGKTQLRVATTGEAAIAYLIGEGPCADRKANPFPALAILDLKLPGLTGFELLTWIRQQQGLHRLPVAVLTGSKNTLDVYRAYELGANSVVVKPVAHDVLRGLLQSAGPQWVRLPELIRRPAPVIAE